MLSIRVGPEREWWVSGETFHRLFQSALEHGEMQEGLEHWRHVADANGGLDISSMQPAEAALLVAGLRRAAERDLANLCNVDMATRSGGYREALIRLLEALTP